MATKKLSPLATKFVKGIVFGKLATIHKDGTPHVTPVWFLFENGKFIVNTAEGRVKLNNVRRDPRVALLMDQEYEYVLVEGRARIARERDPLKDIETLAIRYVGEQQGRKQVRDIYSKNKRFSLEITPERVIEGLR